MAACVGLQVLEQAVEDMQKDLIKIRQSYAEVSATQKRCVHVIMRLLV
jgi:phage shock protein A